MKKLALRWSCVFFTLAASQLLSNCGMDTAQTNKPAMAGPASGGTATTASQTTQPVVADAGGASAMAAMTDASETNQPYAAQQGAPGTALASTETEYRISPRDILQVTVFQVNDLNTAVQVNEDGSVALPLIGKVQVGGRTTYESEQIIAGKLREKYLQSPQVTVSIKTYGKRITVSGEVKGPRVLPDDGGTTLTQAIASAGGVSDLADAKRVHVARSKNQHVQDEVYNLDDIQAGKETDPMLTGGDIVVVEQSGVKVAFKDVSSLLPFAIFASIL